MKKKRVLIDLNSATNYGYCGIAKENRLLFKVFSEIHSIQAQGLLISDKPKNFFEKYQKSFSKIESIEQGNIFFHNLLKHNSLFSSRLFSFLTLTKSFFHFPKLFSIFPIDEIFTHVIWRNVFEKSLQPMEKELVSQSNFYFSNFTAFHTKVAAYFNKKILLDTKQFDIAIFLEPTPVQVSPHTIKIVRFHDAIPLTEPDFGSRLAYRRTLNLLKICARDSYFVCNSEPTRNSLLEIFPELENKAFIIPCLLSDDYKKQLNLHKLQQILVHKLSPQILAKSYFPEIRQKIQNMAEISYIFNLATLDPRKNQINLIRAWEPLHYQSGGKLKLIISANQGWFSNKIAAEMLPHLEMGNIIHVDNLSVEESCYLYSHAKAFVFPSFSEGFGLPPLEAMQCECPTVVSDIPAHRWVMGDASLFCNPYDTNSLSEVIAKLIFPADAEELRNDLIQKGLARVKKFSADSLQESWEKVLEVVR